MAIDKNYDPMSDGILMMNSAQLPQDNSIGKKALNELIKVTRQRPKSIVIELGIYRKYTYELIKYCQLRDKLLQGALKQNERFEDDCSDKKYQRWTNEEDEILIDLICSDQYSLLEISTMMGRTVSALKTRLTKLVGIKRLSQKVAGKFIGTMNGEQIDAEINGTIYKET